MRVLDEVREQLLKVVDLACKHIKPGRIVILLHLESLVLVFQALNELLVLVMDPLLLYVMHLLLRQLTLVGLDLHVSISKLRL